MELFVVLLNWNNFEQTANIVDDLYNQTFNDFDVVIVDNGSTDGSEAKLQNQYPELKIVCKNQNSGFSSGVNTGIQYCLDNDADYIISINVDSSIKSDFIDNCVELINSEPDAAILSGAKYSKDGLVVSAGMEFSHKKAIADNITNLSKKAEPYDVNYVSGSHMILKSEFLYECGLFNEKYFFGMEDIEICYRARQHGWRIVIDPRIQIIHEGGVSVSPSCFYYYHQTRNRLQFATDNLKLVDLIAFTCFFTLSRALLVLLWIHAGKIPIARSVFLGIKDFIIDAPYRRPEHFDQEV